MSVYDVYVQAANLIRQRGWWGGEGRYEGDSPLCLMRAVGAARGDADHGYNSADAHLLGFADLVAAFNWNDAPERTEQEVISRLENAAIHSLG